MSQFVTNNPSAAEGNEDIDEILGGDKLEKGGVTGDTCNNLINTSPPNSFTASTPYAGDISVDDTPLKGQYEKLDYEDPALLVSFFDDSINSGQVTLYSWQTEILEFLGSQKPTTQHPCKYCLCANNGSGKDLFIIAPFAIWFCLSKIKSRVIITSSSGVQLTAQTESYVKALAEKVNKYFGTEIFTIRQRYIKCRLSGSEIRMFATDESGKAEGYHPIEPNREMAIIVNEAKSVSEEIHAALRRCTGYNYWLEISSTGEPRGFFYKAFCSWPNTRRVTSYDCGHISQDEVEKDRVDLGEHSALFRSIHLALFTSVGGETIITLEQIDNLLANPPKDLNETSGIRIGIDLAAGGDENSIVFFKGYKFLREYNFREVDTTITADEVDRILSKEGISKKHEFIFADDGGVGHAIINMLHNKGWNVKCVRNEWQASNKRMYGNRGAENWYRVCRLVEERIIDISGISDKLKDQLSSRKYKKTATSGRIFLESKKEAKAHGHPSPDRADALILALTGISISDILTNKKEDISARPTVKLRSAEDIEKYVDDQAYGISEHIAYSKRSFGSLQTITK